MAVAMKPMDTLEDEAAPSPRGAATPQSSASLGIDLGVLFNRVLEAVAVARLSSGKIVLWNRAAEKLFGYPAEEIIGESVEVLMPPPIAQVHRVGIDRYMRTGHGLIVDADGPVEMPAVTRSGTDIRVEMSLSELRNPAGERFAVAVMRDATQRKTLELTNLELVQTRVARAEAEAELAGRDELLDTVAATLQGAPSDEDLRELATTVAEFRRVHLGQLAVHPAATDLVDIVHAASDAARRRSTNRRLQIYLPPNAWVMCDPARMRQVVDHVLDEAIRRTSGGARLEVRLEMVSAHLSQLTIRSDACGDTRPAGATLQLCRTLVQRQGGTFAVVISSGGGLEVVVTLPGSPRPTPRRTRRARA